MLSLRCLVVKSEAQGGCSAVPCGPEHRGGDVQQRGGITRLLCLPGAAGGAGAPQRIHQIRCAARHKEWVFTRAPFTAPRSINVLDTRHKSQHRSNLGMNSWHTCRWLQQHYVTKQCEWAHLCGQPTFSTNRHSTSPPHTHLILSEWGLKLKEKTLTVWLNDKYILL